MELLILIGVVGAIWLVGSLVANRRAHDTYGFPTQTGPQSVSPKVPRPQPTAATRAERPRRKPDPELASIELNDDFKTAMRLIEQQHQTVFITGKAGTGKSTLLRYFRAHTQKSIVVLAPTGIAAINVGGQTIHSFFKFPPRFIDREKLRKKRNADLFRRIDTVVIDEVSMVRADLMDGIDYSLRLNRDNLAVPFGGAQIVFFGDLFQLPPIVRERELKEFFESHYGGPYFFRAKVFRDIRPRFIDLERVYRQSDKQFLEILNQIRQNTVSHETLRVLNSKVTRVQDLSNFDSYITLTTTNDAAYTMNETCMSKIKEREFMFQAIISGRFDSGSYPTESELKLKKGAHVMMIKNDPDKRWVNGTLAKIASVNETRVGVDIRGSVYEVQRASWENIEYDFHREMNRIEEKVVGTFQQFPLRLAWAITIHKSQGQTLDRVFIDLANGAFAHGQTYVALSRCRSLEGIALSRPVKPSDIIVDGSVNDFTKIFCDGNQAS
jgi:ATP-dependent DNA helicase PIF1